MEHQRIIVIGSSAGGVNALKTLISSLPKNFDATIFVIQHLSPDTKSMLPDILSTAGLLPASHPQDGEVVKAGHVYVARPDHHLVICENIIQVRKGPKENRFRPSIDVTMRSVALEYGNRVIGIVLTGMLNDGTSGLWSICEMGGMTIIQDLKEALYPDMPRNVLKHMEVDFQLPLAEIGPLLVKLVAENKLKEKKEQGYLAKRMKAETGIAAEKNALEAGVLKMGEPSNLTCPECGGALVSLKEGKLMRYRCHTGHAFSADSLKSGINESMETSLWQALRTVEEGIIFLEQAATHSQSIGEPEEADKLTRDAASLRNKARTLLDFIYD